MLRIYIYKDKILYLKLFSTSKNYDIKQQDKHVNHNINYEIIQY